MDPEIHLIKLWKEAQPEELILRYMQEVDASPIFAWVPGTTNRILWYHVTMDTPVICLNYWDIHLCVCACVCVCFEYIIYKYEN